MANRKPPGSRVIAFRIPEALHRDIKEAAKLSGSKMTDEITWRLRLSFEKLNGRTAMMMMMNSMLDIVRKEKP